MVTAVFSTCSFLASRSTAKLLCEDDEVAYGDFAYLGVEKREEIQQDEHLKNIDFRINRSPSRNRISEKYEGIDWD